MKIVQSNRTQESEARPPRISRTNTKGSMPISQTFVPIGAIRGKLRQSPSIHCIMRYLQYRSFAKLIANPAAVTAKSRSSLTLKSATNVDGHRAAGVSHPLVNPAIGGFACTACLNRALEHRLVPRDVKGLMVIRLASRPDTAGNIHDDRDGPEILQSQLSDQ